MHRHENRKLGLAPLMLALSVLALLACVRLRLSQSNHAVAATTEAAPSRNLTPPLRVDLPSKNDAGEYVQTTYANGEKRNAGTLVNGKREGEWTFWDPKGRPLSRQTFVAGAPHGPYVIYYPSGAVHFEGNLAEGQRHGRWVTYDESERVVSVQCFQRGRPIGTIEYFDSHGRTWLRVDAATGRIVHDAESPSNAGPSGAEEDCGCDA